MQWKVLRNCFLWCILVLFLFFFQEGLIQSKRLMLFLVNFTEKKSKVFIFSWDHSFLYIWISLEYADVSVFFFLIVCMNQQKNRRGIWKKKLTLRVNNHIMFPGWAIARIFWGTLFSVTARVQIYFQPRKGENTNLLLLLFSGNLPTMDKTLKPGRCKMNVCAVPYLLE